MADYFSSVTEFMARSERLGRGLVTVLFPNEEISAEAVARVDAFLAKTDLTPTLRRSIAEGRDSVARALRARERVATTA